MEKIKNYTKLLQEKTDVAFRLELMTLVLLYLSSSISLLFSLWDIQRRLVTFITLSIVFSLLIMIIIIIKWKVKNYRLLNGIYFIASLGVVGLILALTYDRSTISIMIFLGPAVMMSFINYEKRYINFLMLLYFVMILYFWFAKPAFDITLSRGFYINNFMIIFLVTYVSKWGIQLFREYEALLHEKVNEVNTQNEHLILLNRQLITSEEEARQQFIEIDLLHKDAEKLIERLNSVFDVSHDGIIDIDYEKGYIKASIQSTKILDESFEQQTNFTKMITSRMKSEHIHQFNKVWQEIVQFDGLTHSMELEFLVRGQVRELRFQLLSYKSNVDESLHIVVVVRDITEEALVARKIYKVAYEDQLTGLMNRIAFADTTTSHRILEPNKLFRIYIMDIDNFKYINDTIGYEFGDGVLKAVAQKIKAVMHPKVIAIARISGDEFAFLSDSHFEGVEFSNWVQKELNIFYMESVELRINFSIGYTSTCDIKETSNTLLKNAEIAMYKAKEKGKNGYFEYSEVLHDELKKQVMINTELEKALDQNEFSLNYQPKIDARSREIVGFEALIRWNSKRLGQISPYEFITLAEKTGSIHVIGLFVIREAFKFAKRINVMRSEQNFLKVSVNVSVVQLFNRVFFDQFMELMQEMDINPLYIGIEVTETAIMEDKELIFSLLEMFRLKHITVYLDDFGTGYSSLNYLAQLPFDVLKIDKTFIDHIQKKGKEYQIIQPRFYVSTS